MLDKGQEEDWFDSRFIVVLAVAFAVGLLAWVARELNTRDPVADLRVFRQAPFAAGTMVMALQGFVMYGSQVTISIWLQTLLGYPSVQAGVAMVAMGLGAALAMPMASFLVSRFDPRKVFVCGVLGFAFSFYQLMGFNLEIGFWDVFWPQFLQGAFAWAGVCAAHGCDHGFHPQREDGERHQFVQYDAEHRRGSGHFVSGNHADPHGAGAHQLAGRQYHPDSPLWRCRLVGGLRGLFAGSGPGWPTSKLTPPSLVWCSAKPPWWR